MRDLSREEIENSDSGIFSSLDNENNLLVSFGGIWQGMGIPVYEFFNTIKNVECDKMFLRDLNQTWYNRGVDKKIKSSEELTNYLERSISQNGYKKVTFLGNSMGGYAAIMFGTRLKVDNVLSFAPQTFIDRWRRLLYFDRRWKDRMKVIYRTKEGNEELVDLKKLLMNTDGIKTNIDIYYSPKHRLDKIHAERLKETENVNLIPIESGGHGVVKTLRDRGVLKKIIEEKF